jgi:Zn-dependent protease with chaperone function
MTAIVLGVLALVLVGPGPLWVVRWRFLHRVPRAAVVLWQAGALAALLSIIGAGLALGLPGLEWSELPQRPVAEQAAYAVIAIFIILVIARLAWSLVSVARLSGTRRSRHRAAVDLLGQVDESMSLPGLRVLAEQLPIAYCLPGVRGARVVLSEGTLAALSKAEVSAVLEHESAHVRARHDLVLDTFTALHRAFPYAVRSEIPAQQCRLLVEMLADDAARRRTGPLPLARALVALAGAPKPAGALGVASLGVVERLARLSAEPQSSRWLSGGVYLLAAGLVAGPAVILALPL